jgi:hypothetical protein
MLQWKGRKTLNLWCAMPAEPIDSLPVFDQGHRGEVDYTQIAEMLAMTPTQRLRHHERWRLFVKEVASRAKLCRGDDRQAGPG